MRLAKRSNNLRMTGGMRFREPERGGYAWCITGHRRRTVAGLPCRGDDIVGAGDAVMANLALALADHRCRGDAVSHGCGLGGDSSTGNHRRGLNWLAPLVMDA